MITRYHPDLIDEARDAMQIPRNWFSSWIRHSVHPRIENHGTCAFISRLLASSRSLAFYKSIYLKMAKLHSRTFKKSINLNRSLRLELNSPHGIIQV